MLTVRSREDGDNEIRDLENGRRMRQKEASLLSQVKFKFPAWIAIYKQRQLEEEKDAESSTTRSESRYTSVTALNRSSSSQDALEPSLREANREEFLELLRTNPGFFVLYESGRLKLHEDQMIGIGSQGKVYAATLDGKDCVVKVFADTPRLEDLQRKWPLQGLIDAKDMEYHTYPAPGSGALTTACHYSPILAGTMLEENGAFAFVMDRYWGDLHTVIDLKMMANKYQGPPFLPSVTLGILRDVATGIFNLHQRGILHKDVKSANVLLRAASRHPEGPAVFTLVNGNLISTQRLQDHDVPVDFDPCRDCDDFHCFVADFDSSLDANGTTYFQAPEVLLAFKECESTEDVKKKVEIFTKAWTEKADVFSFAMTCYEILLGCTPFQHLKVTEYGELVVSNDPENERVTDDDIISGVRPLLPDYFSDSLRCLLKVCWHQDAAKRPSMAGVVDFLQSEQFRLYGFLDGLAEMQEETELGPPDESIVDQLMDIGQGIWERDLVQRALREAYNNPDRAVQYLETGIMPSEQVSTPANPEAPLEPNAPPLDALQSTPSEGGGRAGSEAQFGSPDESTVEEVMGIGQDQWDRDLVRRALREASNDINTAVENILSEMPRVQDPAPVDPEAPFESNASPLNLSPQVVPAEDGGSTRSGASLEILRGIPEFLDLRTRLQADRETLQLINDNQTEFVRLINEPAVVQIRASSRSKRYRRCPGP